MLRSTLRPVLRSLGASGLLPSVGAVRHLNLHEYQSKQLMRDYDVSVQPGDVASTKEEALAVARKLKEAGAVDLVLKSQIHAGGRGKGHFDTGFKGGVKVHGEPEEVAASAEAMLGNHLITKQTGPDGQLVSKVLILEGIDIVEEKYVAFLMDRAYGGPVIVSSVHGGMDIEEVAEETPEAIVTTPVDIMEGLRPGQARGVAESLVSGDSVPKVEKMIENLYKLFIEKDSTMLEINPLAITGDGEAYSVDAKFIVDDNADFRHADLMSWRDTAMEDPMEVEASKVGLNYIRLDGNIACMVNGAGLAMGTMDIIKLKGASPANFLDVGGSATEEQVKQAFELITSDPNVKSILVNIFGGIMRCDTIATGIVNAARSLDLKVPLVVRLEGTKSEEGAAILDESGLAIVSASDLDDAATKAVASLS